MLNITPKRLRIPRKEGASENPLVSLLLEYEGTRDWGVIPAEFLIDGTTVVNAPLGDGLPMWVEIEAGTHTLELRYAGQNPAYTLDCSGQGDYTLRIKYSRFGGFKAELHSPSGVLDLSKAISGVSTGGRFFNCKTLNTGPAGLVENFSLGGVSAPTLRPAKVKIQDDTLLVSFQDSSGISHDAVSMPVAQITSVETHEVTKGKQVGLALKQMLGTGVGLGIAMALLIAFNVGIDKMTAGGALLILGMGLVFGFILAFLFVFVPNLFRARSDLKQMVFHAAENKSFGVVLDKNQMAEAIRTLDWAGIKLNGN